jgi:hypothetical protein
LIGYHEITAFCHLVIAKVIAVGHRPFSSLMT